MTSAPHASLIQRLQRYWDARSAKQRNALAAGVALVLCLAYGLGIYPRSAHRADKLAYELQKLSVRAKAASKSGEVAFVPPPSLAGVNPAQAEREHKALLRQLEETTQELRALRAQFLPLDDSLAMNALKSGLTSLAEAGDMEVTAIEHVVTREQDKDSAPSAELLRSMANANPFKRPLVRMRARASFRGLMQFLDGLPQLPYIAAPVASSIVVVVERNPKTNAPVRQWLDVRITLAL